MNASLFLLIDIGNTRVKWATCGARGRIQVAGDRTTGEISVGWLHALTRKYPAQHVVLASVVPKWIPAFRRAFGKRLHVVTGQSPYIGLEFDYPNPGELGADRVASAVTAKANGTWPVIIVNCGTATAFTVLDKRGRVCGGVIAPGLQTQLNALVGATAQLPTVTLKPTRRYLGKSTQEAIRAGVMLNFQGGVKEILAHLSALFQTPPRILLTGGNASHLARTLGKTITLRPLLVFEGLRMIGLRAFNQVL